MSLSKEFLVSIDNVADAALKHAGSAVLPFVDQIRQELRRLLEINAASPAPQNTLSFPANDSNIKSEPGNDKKA